MSWGVNLGKGDKEGRADWPTRKDKRGGASVLSGQKKRAPRGCLGALVGASKSIARKGGKEEEESEKETQGEVA